MRWWGPATCGCQRGLRSPFPAFWWWFFFGLAFNFFSQALLSIPLGVAYAVWTGVGVALTFAVSATLFKEKVTTLKLAGVLVIVSSAALLNLAGSGA